MDQEKKKEKKEGALFVNPPSEDPLVDEPSLFVAFPG